MHDLALMDDCRRHRNPRPHPLRALPLRRPIASFEFDQPTSFGEVRSKLGCSWCAQHRLRQRWLRLRYNALGAATRRDAFAVLSAFEQDEPAWFRYLILESGNRGHLAHPYQFGLTHRPKVLGVPLQFPSSGIGDPIETTIGHDTTHAVRLALAALPVRQRRAVALRMGLVPMPCDACAASGRTCDCAGDPPTYAAIGRVLDPGHRVSAQAARSLVRRGLATLSKNARLRQHFAA